MAGTGTTTTTGSPQSGMTLDQLLTLAGFGGGTTQQSGFRETDIPGVIFDPNTGHYFMDGRRVYATELQRLIDREAEKQNTLSPNVAAQQELGLAQLAESRRQSDRDYLLDMQKYEQQVREWNKQYGLDLERLQLQRDQLTLAERQGRRDEARGFAVAIADQQARMNDNLIQLSNIQNNAALANTQLQTQVAMGNADRRMQAAQAAASRTMQLLQLTEEMRSRNIDQQIQIAGQIADYSRDPGDIVANIAAQQQFGSISTALSEGFTGLTEDALRVGGLHLENRDRARSEGERLGQQAAGLSAALQRSLDPSFGFTEVQAPQFTPVVPQMQFPDIAALFNQFLGSQAPPAREQEQAGFSTGTAAPGADLSELDALIARQIADAEAKRGIAVRPDGQVDTGKAARSFADGGVGLFNVPTTVQVAEDGPEALIAVKPESIDRARELLLAAFRPALARFQAAAPGIPTFAGGVTPVGVSAPGTSQELQEAAAGLTAAGSGVRRSSFFNELARVTPRGISEGVVRRTR